MIRRNVAYIDVSTVPTGSLIDVMENVQTIQALECSDERRSQYLAQVTRSLERFDIKQFVEDDIDEETLRREMERDPSFKIVL